MKLTLACLSMTMWIGGVGCIVRSSMESVLGSLGNPPSFGCVDRHFAVAYKDLDPELWTALKRHGPRVASCSDAREVAAFLPLVRHCGC